jgi:hypothetical protein
VSQYIDHTPLQHAARGWVLASRQNAAVDGRNPWCLIGSLRAGESYATDSLQFHGLASRRATLRWAWPRSCRAAGCSMSTPWW